MQDIVFYATANETLGVVRDYANARTVSAPTLTRGVSVALHMRLFDDANDLEPYPVEAFENIAAWSFVMDDDFNDETAFKVVADNVNISVSDVEETTPDPADPEITQTRHYTEFVIPIPDMNTEALANWIGTSKSKGGLIGELVGFDTNGTSVFVLQVEGFTIRNRLTGSGEPSENVTEYLTIDEARAMFADAATAEENAFNSAVIVSGDNEYGCDGVYRFFAKTKIPWYHNMAPQIVVQNVFINEEKKAFIRYQDGEWQLVKGNTLSEQLNIVCYFYPWRQSSSNINCPPTDYWYKASGQTNTFIRFVPRINIFQKKY